MKGDDIFVTEDTYLQKVGSLVTTVDLLVKRLGVKDEYIRELESKVQELESKLSASNLTATNG